MKYLIIISILVIICALLYLRLRPYIQMARRMLGIFREVRGVSRSNPADTLRQPTSTDTRLVRCASCNTWIPAARALQLRASQSSYCSHECLERAAEGGKQKKVKMS